jgi:hypothetical protein
MDPLESHPTTDSFAARFLSFASAIAVGFAAATAGGVVWGLATRLSIPEGIGYAIVALGTTVLLVGGASGGGFVKQLDPGGSRRGGVFGVNLPPEHDGGVADPLESTGIGGQGMLHHREPDIDFLKRRLVNELRPRRNPDAFWTVIGGTGMIAVGLAVLWAF